MSKGVEHNVAQGFPANLAPTLATIAPPPMIPTTKSTSNFLINLLALKVAVNILKAALREDNFVAAWPPA